MGANVRATGLLNTYAMMIRLTKFFTHMKDAMAGTIAWESAAIIVPGAENPGNKVLFDL